METLVIEQKKGLFDKLSGCLELHELVDFNLPVYRLEIDPDIAIYFYLLNKEIKPQETILDNIFPHIKNIILLSRYDDFKNWQLPENLSKRLNEIEDGISFYVITLINEDLKHTFSKEILNQGFLISAAGRLLLWDSSDEKNAKHIWKTVGQNVGEWES
jgi:hypothetical protein